MEKKEEQEEQKNPIQFQSNRILSYDQMLVHFEQIFKSKENCYCFECGQPAKTWASINNAIFLCMKCSQIHRSFGINISFIRSVELDCWNEKQLMLLQLGGNENLKKLFERYNLYENIDKTDNQAVGYKYFTKAAQYYRNKLNAMVEKLQVIPEPPSLEEGQQLIDIKKQIFPAPPVANQIELYQIQETARGEEEKKNSLFSSLQKDIKNFGDKIEQFGKEQINKVQKLVKKKEKPIQEQLIEKEENKVQEEIKADEQLIEIKPLTFSQKLSQSYNKFKTQISQAKLLGADELGDKYNKSEFKVKLKTYQEKVSLQTKKIGDAVSKQTTSITTKIKEGYDELRTKKNDTKSDQQVQEQQQSQEIKKEEQIVQSIDKIEL